jgi:hypothetical protein
MEMMVVERLPAEEISALIESSHPDIHAMVAYWHRKAGGRAMPRRADIDPAELKPFLPRITLVDVVPDPRRFVYRLVGTEEVAARGRDPTGLAVADGYFGPNAEAALEHYEYVRLYKEPYCYRGKFEAPDRVIEEEDVIFLPLSEDGETVNMILVFYFDYRFQPRVEDGSLLLKYRSRRDTGDSAD